MDRWLQRVILVTGASSGIGAASAKLLSDCGMKVVACARRVEMIQQMQQDGHPNIFPYKCDLTKPLEVSAMFDWIESHPDLGRVDACLSNAGRISSKPLLEASVEEWHNLCNLNIVAQCQCTQLSIKSMIKHKLKDGQIILMSSGYGRYQPLAGKEVAHFYAATKHALQSLMNGWRAELRQVKSTHGCDIRICVISPGGVYTEDMGRLFHMPVNEVRKLTRQQDAPFLEPEAVAEAVKTVLETPAGVQIQDMVVHASQEVF